MKRFYVIAAIAASLLATGCQKTYVIDEVRTPIGFSTEVGKQTKAIMDGTSYDTGHTFGVFAYALTGGKNWEGDASDQNQVMNNVEIKRQNDGTESEPKWVWREQSGKKYYWPNATDTKLNFFAYSPFSDELGQVPTFVLPKGITLTSYTHSNFTGSTAVDFMVADGDAMKNMQYTSGEGGNNGVVPTLFNHKMTQVCFVIKKDIGLDDATFTLTSLKLKEINNKANFNAAENWSGQTGNQEYTTTIPSDAEITEDGISPAPVTMIPQTLSEGTQQFEIVYTIEGTGFANETVTRTFDIKTDRVDAWTPSMRVTYTLTVKMNEITFNPTVENWTDASGSIDIVQ